VTQQPAKRSSLVPLSSPPRVIQLSTTRSCLPQTPGGRFAAIPIGGYRPAVARCGTVALSSGCCSSHEDWAGIAGGLPKSVRVAAARALTGFHSAGWQAGGGDGRVAEERERER
jgi:hypothetical protein